MSLKVHKIAAFVLIVIILMSMAVSASSVGMPNDVYTHWDTYDGKIAVYSRPMYMVRQVISSHSLKLEKSIENLTDVCSDSKGNTYVLVGGQSRLLILNPDYTLKTELNIVSQNGESVDFTGAKGIYVDDKEIIYIADTENAQVLLINQQGVVTETLLLPESKLIPSGFTFRPIRLVKDYDGYIYVLSEGSYYGALLYSPDYDFLGFFGANTVNVTITGMINQIWDLLFTNSAKKAASVKVLPYQFVDLYVGKDNYIYTTTGATTSTETFGAGQLKKLSPSGVNILKKKMPNGLSIDSNSFNFLETVFTTRLGKRVTQNLSGIAVNDKGFIFAYDATYGKIYVYDSECNLLSAFGGGTGTGIQKGTYQIPVAIEINGNQILVGDSKKNTITVYDITDYGTMVQDAQSLTIKGNYAQAAPIWQQVLKLDRNSRVAYRGLGKYAFVSGDYKTAMKYSKMGLDKTTYDQAYEFVKREFTSRNFIWLFLLGILAVAAFTAFMVISTKRQLVLINNVKIRTMMQSMLHPFRCFGDVKHKKLGSVPLALIIVFLLYIISVAKEIWGGFLFTRYDSSSFNAIYVLAQTVGLIVLWSVVNWGISSLFEGKGKLDEIFIVSAYSCIPLLIDGIIFMALSHTLSLNNAVLLDSIHMVAIIATGWLLVIGMIVIHDFSFFKFIGTGVVTIFGMLLVIFILFMIGILLQQFTGFIATLFMEVMYR